MVRVVERLKAWGGVQTYQVEFAFAALVMALSTAFTSYLRGSFDWREVIGVLAVLVLFKHGQVSDRLSEKEGARAAAGDLGVECWYLERRYFQWKEVLWFVYFVSHQAWSALVGVFLLFGYRYWREAWRAVHPLKG